MSVYPGIGGLHGQHWNTFAQAQGGPAQQPNFGALGQAAQIAAPGAQFAQLAQLQARQQSLAQAYQNPFAPCPRPRPIEDAGISAGEIVGHRAWFATPGGLLRSMATNAVWSPQEAMHGNVETAGVHAFKTQTYTLSEYGSMDSSAGVVIGTVALWGEVIEHERGYRAEFGKVLSVDLICGVSYWREQRLLRRIRRRYRL